MGKIGKKTKEKINKDPFLMMQFKIKSKQFVSWVEALIYSITHMIKIGFFYQNKYNEIDMDCLELNISVNQMTAFIPSL